MADITKNKTNTGATAFNAPTNKEPKIETHLVASGIVTAKIITNNHAHKYSIYKAHLVPLEN
jgi:hypothetical protein